MSFLANRAPAKTSATPAARPTGAGRYAGLRSDNSLPRLVRGRYLCEVLATRFVEGFNGKNWFLEVKIHEANEGSANAVGTDAVVQVSLKSAKAEIKGMQKIKRICMVATGHTEDAKFEAAYPTWEDLIDRVMGFELDEDVFGADGIKGARMWIDASNSTNQAEDGSYYQNYAFMPDAA